MTRVAIIDYGMGNLHSIRKALEHVAPNMHITVTSDPKEALRCARMVFPGVGAIRDCMGEIHRLGLDEAVREAAECKPLLGICVGMQALMDFSEENEGTRCLGILPGEVRYFGERTLDRATQEVLKVPHMGWNQVHHSRAHPLWQAIPDNTRFYFVHSYYVHPADQALEVARVDYGIGFAAAVSRGNLFAVQFHPEKSQRAGLTLLSNFLRWDGD
jgi:imidazole glycerol phosphate synthase, glutamine amidotransferase subunit